ncbi:hypothetical protein [Parashewanella tropica]|uniref:hypothetical protein n=1 Tax=Parashewanella tropica TaxID=2547970 RepID=UPI00105A364B|nr:hypothetical protein [Parashewanella tropica]
MNRLTTILLFSVWIVVLTISGSWLFEVPVAFSFACVSTLVVIGHVVTFDEELKGGWSNPEGNPKIVKWSTIELICKILFSIIIWWLVLTYPYLSRFSI